MTREILSTYRQPMGQLTNQVESVMLNTTEQDRRSLPDAAFALVTKKFRLFPHHDSIVTDGADTATVDRSRLRDALARLPRSNLSATQKASIWAHLAEHARELGMKPTAPVFSNGPQPSGPVLSAELLRDAAECGEVEWGERLVESIDAETLADIRAAVEAESGRVRKDVMVISTGRRFVNGRWLEVTLDETDVEARKIGLKHLKESFELDASRGIRRFVDVGHSFSNRQGDLISELSFGDILGLKVDEDGEGGGVLLVDTLFTPRAARHLSDGELNLTSIAFAWGGMDNLTNPPKPRGPFFINYALTNNPAWQGQEPIAMTDEQAAVDGGENTCEFHNVDPQVIVEQSDVSLIDLRGGTLEEFIKDIRGAVRKFAKEGLFGAVSGFPCVHLISIMEGEVVVINCDEGGQAFMAAWARSGDAGAIALTNARKAKKVYVAARNEETMADPAQTETTDNTDIEALRAEVEALKSENEQLRAAERADDITVTADPAIESLRSEFAALKTENESLREEVTELKVDKREALRDKALMTAKTRGLPSSLEPEAKMHFNAGGDEALTAYVDRMDAAGLLVPIGRRTGAGGDGSGGDGTEVNNDAATAHARLDELRAEAKEKGETLTTRQALKALRKENEDLYRAIAPVR